MEIVDEPEDLLRRPLDARAALDAKAVGLRRGEDENGGDDDDGNDPDDRKRLEHASLRSGFELTASARTDAD
jgi:hypothetical protein